MKLDAADNCRNEFCITDLQLQEGDKYTLLRPAVSIWLVLPEIFPYSLLLPDFLMPLLVGLRTRVNECMILGEL